MTLFLKLFPNIFCMQKADNKRVFFEAENISDLTLEKLSIKTVEYCLLEGEKYLEETIQSGRNIHSNCVTLMGWIVAALLPLFGFFIYQIEKEGNDFYVFVSLYGIIALGIVAFRLVKGTLFGNEIYACGDFPSHPIRKEVMECLKEMDDPDDIHKYVIGWELDDIQFRISQNIEENGKRLSVYTSSIKLLLVFFILSLPLIFLAAVFLH